MMTMGERHTQLNVQGMSCEHCRATVRTALERVPGVHSAEVRLQEACAAVVHDEGVSPEQLAAAVTRVGFDASVEPPVPR